MITGNYFTNNEDLLLHFQSITDWKELVDAYEHGFTDAEKNFRKKSAVKL